MLNFLYLKSQFISGQNIIVDGFVSKKKPITATIIGVGNLGKRHAQGLSLSKEISSLYLVDKNEKSLFEAKIIVKSNLEIHYVSNIIDLPNEIDLAIISTDASVRIEILTELIQQKK